MAQTKAAKRSFSEEERLAMKERVKETRSGKTDGETDVREKLATMPAADRAMGERLHAIIKASVPELSPRLWYGMPAYYKGDKLICHYQNASKFKMRYGTLGFSDKANLDEGKMWPNAYAVQELTAAEEQRISELVKRAVS